VVRRLAVVVLAVVPFCVAVVHAQVDGPWIGGSTWDPTQKLAVGGSVRWRSTTRFRLAASRLRITGNALPIHPTGT
jgi:hypothetical protein